MSFLIGEDMTCGYGGTDILHVCTVGVDPGEIAVVVGPNGAGKSTAMKAMFGMLDLREGRVMLDGTDISALAPQERVLHGMGFVPQTNNVFTSMTVEENLEMGAFIRRDEIADTMAQVFDLFPVLRDKRRQPAGELVRILGDNLDAETLTYLDENTRDEIVDVMGMEALTRQLPDLETDDAVNIIEELEQDEIDDVLAVLPAEDRVLVEEGLAYPEDFAGRMMQRKIVTVPSFWTVGRTNDFLRSSQFSDTQFYLIFVIDPSSNPIGEISLRRLLCTAPPASRQ